MSICHYAMSCRGGDRVRSVLGDLWVDVCVRVRVWCGRGLGVDVLKLHATHSPTTHHYCISPKLGAQRADEGGG